MSVVTPASGRGTQHEGHCLVTWQPVTTLPTPFTAGGRTYRVIIEGLERNDGTWAGRITFADGESRVSTDQETSQPDRAAVEYWASGLERVYLEGAFRRARDLQQR